MDKTELLYTKYDTAVKEVLERYLQLFQGGDQGKRSLVEGISFLAKHNDAYKDEVNKIATAVIEESGSGHGRLYYRLHKQNQEAMNALLNSIYNEAIGIKDTKKAQ